MKNLRSSAPPRLKKYLAYKDSGIEWLDNIPSHWDRVSLKHVVKIPITDGPHESPELVDDGIPFISAEAVKDRKLDFSKKRGYITEDLHRVYCRKCEPKRGDIFMVKSGNTTGAVAMVETDETFSIWSPLALIRTNPKWVHNRFLFHLMNSDFFQRSVQLSWSHGTQPNIGMDVISDLYTTLPTLAEQKSIASLLDHKTTEIDALIAKKRWMIELLQEKRTAVISHAVTKGLDPNAPMKDSGVEWLDNLPRHWGMVPLKFVLLAKPGAIKTGPFGSQLLSSEMLSGLIKVYNQRNVIDMDFIGGDNYITEEKYSELSAFSVEPRDILVTTRGTIGRCAIFPMDAEPGILHPCLMRIQIDERKVLIDYLALLIQDGSIIREQLRLKSNATTIEVIYSDSLKQVKLPLPPISEQLQILSLVNEQTTKTDAMITKVSAAIDKLLEYRTALISAAVTGKIDVRNEVRA